MHRIISRDFFFYQFFPYQTSSDQCFEITHNINIQPTSDNIDIPDSITQRPDYITELGKIAFKHIFGEQSSKNSSTSLFRDICKFYAEFKPSGEEMDFIHFMFENNNRIKNFFSKNFTLFDYSVKSRNINDEIYFIDLENFFKEILLNPEFRDSLIQTKSPKNFLDSCFDGSSIKSSPKTRLLLSLYVDDFDPLISSVYQGPSSHKTTGIYLKILNISQKVSSKRIFVCPFMIFTSSCNKDDWAYDFASKKINEFATNGISINVGGSIVKYDVEIIACCSDNLAAHELLGLSTPSCGYPCRFCSESLQSMQENYVPQSGIIRTSETIKDSLIAFNAISKTSNNLLHFEGVKARFKFDIKGLDNPFNFPSCISHDFFEKIIPQTLFVLLKRMHHDKLLNFTDCTEKLKSFVLNSTDNSNKFKISINGFSGSASQMRTLAKVFMFVLRDEIPLDHQLSNGFYLLFEIFQMINSPYFYKSWFKKLKKNIKEFLIFYRVSLDMKIYPKLHYLIHYCDLIKRFGPLNIYCTDIFESVHKEFKKHLISSACHKNISKTMFTGVLGYYSYKISSIASIFDAKISKKFTNVSFDDLPLHLKDVFSDSEAIKIVKFVKYNSFQFYPGYFIYKCHESSNHFFYRIEKIYIRESKQILDVFTDTALYDSKTSSYLIVDSGNTPSHLNIDDIWYEPQGYYNSEVGINILSNFKYFE